MERRCVYYYVIVSLIAFFLLFIVGRKVFGKDENVTSETPGLLMATDREGNSLGTCPLVHTDVKAEIGGILSRVTVHQLFRNSFSEPIEAVYAFPLPHNAAVDDMTIQTGERKIRGVIKRREEARTIYNQARARGQLAALLDQERPNIFTQQIANILPGQDVDVFISYVETLKYEKGGYSFIFPMVVGPRYIPGDAIGKKGGGWAHDTNKVPDASKITPPVTPPGTRSGHDISIEVSLNPGVPFTNLRSGQHQITAIKKNPDRATVRLADSAVIPNKDFLLSYDVAGSQLQDGLVTHRSGNDGYFTLILQPPRSFNPSQVVPKELVFVLDTSGSMQGYPIQKAKETMTMALESLYPQDTFNLITFSGDTRILFPQPVPATRANVELARQVVEESHGRGGTEMMRAIRAALEPSDEQGHIRIVCFMTDGLVGNDMEIISEVQRHPNARVFAFGIGSSPNRFLLDKISEEGRGAVEYVTLQGDASAAALRFHERIRNPLLTDITLEWSGTPVSDIYPRRIPDVFSAEPVVICGRYSHSGSALLRLRGRSGTDDFVRDIRIPLPDKEPSHDVLSTLWARNRIEALMAEDFVGIQRGNMRPDLKEAITQLGLDFRMMTQFTSFVAVEERVSTQGGKPVTIQVPVEMPEGIRYEGGFGIPASAAPIIGVRGGIVGGVPGGVVAGFIAPTEIPHSIPPPARPVRRDPIRVGGNVQDSKLIKKVDPVYPELAKRARVSGSVSLELRIDAEGNVSDARVINGPPLLTEAALNAAKQWKYSPTLLNGEPVPATAQAVLEFKLDGSSGYFFSESRIDAAIERVLARLKAGQPVEGETFVKGGKAEIELVLSKKEGTMANLRLLGFEIISGSEASGFVVGRIPIEKLEALLKIDAVRRISAHY